MKFALLGLLLLAGCETIVSPTSVCTVHVKPWTAAEQNQMANDLEKIPNGSILIAVFMDYADMREEAKVCLASE